MFLQGGTYVIPFLDEYGVSLSVLFIVVCEMIAPLEIAAPAVGSHVRVYGVSRFDSQRDREWYEIHPVLRVDQLPGN